MPAPPYSVSVQKDVIRGSFNSALLSVLFLGVYTVIYFGSFYVYSVKRVSRHAIVIGTISLSYIVYVVATACEWYQTQWAFVDNGDTRDTVFVAMLDSPRWYILTGDICRMLLGGFADGLMIWRCYNVWNRSKRIVFLPLLLLLAEIGVDLYVVKAVCDSNLDASSSQAQALDRLGAVLLFLTLATTLITTLLISYRVYTISKDSVQYGPSTQCSRIIELLVQSAALYALATLAYATAAVVPFKAGSLGPLVGIQYTASFYLFSAGVAPTIMSVRVAFLSDDQEIHSANHVSALQFESRHTANLSSLSSRTSVLVESESSHLQPPKE